MRDSDPVGPTSLVPLVQGARSEVVTPGGLTYSSQFSWRVIFSFVVNYINIINLTQHRHTYTKTIHYIKSDTEYQFFKLSVNESCIVHELYTPKQRTHLLGTFVCKETSMISHLMTLNFLSSYIERLILFNYELILGLLRRGQRLCDFLMWTLTLRRSKVMWHIVLVDWLFDNQHILSFFRIEVYGQELLCRVLNTARFTGQIFLLSEERK